MKNLIILKNNEALVVAEDKWVLIEDDITTPLHDNSLLRPQALAQYLEQSQKVSANIGIWLTPDNEVETLAPLLPHVSMIAIQFPDFRDGRGYSQAYILKTRMGWEGELRAFGDVLRDQLSHMQQCGFTSFAIKEGRSAEDATKGLKGISVLYGSSVIEARPLFRRRNV